MCLFARNEREKFFDEQEHSTTTDPAQNDLWLHAKKKVLRRILLHTICGQVSFGIYAQHTSKRQNIDNRMVSNSTRRREMLNEMHLFNYILRVRVLFISRCQFGTCWYDGEYTYYILGVF